MPTLVTCRNCTKISSTFSWTVLCECHFGGLERLLEAKTTAGPFFFSQCGPSLADLAVFDNVESPFPGLKKLGQDLSAYPKILALAKAVGEDAQISAFAANGFKL